MEEHQTMMLSLLKDVYPRFPSSINLFINELVHLVPSIVLLLDSTKVFAIICQTALNYKDYVIIIIKNCQK
jgi:hypothetical protein